MQQNMPYVIFVKKFLHYNAKIFISLLKVIRWQVDQNDCVGIQGVMNWLTQAIVIGISSRSGSMTG